MVPVLIGIVTLVALDRFLASEILSTRQAAFNVLRLAEVTSLVSPTVPVFALSAAVYLWGLWNLWRVHEQAVEFGAGASVLAVLREDQPIVAGRFSRLLDAPELAIGLAATAVLGSVLFLEAAAAGLGFPMQSADGKEMAADAFGHGPRELPRLSRPGPRLSPGAHAAPGAPLPERGPDRPRVRRSRRPARAVAALRGDPRAREVHVLVQQMRATVSAFQEARAAALGPPVSLPEPPEPPPTAA